MKDILPVLILATLALTATTCRDPAGDDQRAYLSTIVVKAPATGQIQRLLISEGVKVNAGAPILELATESIPAPTHTPADDPENRAVHNVEAADREVEAARDETVRNEAEVQRLTPLVAAGQASPAELDGARAQYDRAQQRMQRAKDVAQASRASLDRARQPGSAPSAPPAVNQAPTIIVRAPAAGTLTVFGARMGDRVIAGQPLATIHAD